MTADADYHRTFEKFVPNRLGMWPEFKRTTFARSSFHDRGKYAEVEEIAKASKAFYAYHRVGEKGPAADQADAEARPGFQFLCNRWEDTYSTLTSIWKQRVEPVVDDELKVAGHYGWWWASEILFPVGVPHGKVDHMIAPGIPMFAGERNPMPTYWRTAYDGSPQWKYLLLDESRPDRSKACWRTMSGRARSPRWHHGNTFSSAAPPSPWSASARARASATPSACSRARRGARRRHGPDQGAGGRGRQPGRRRAGCGGMGTIHSVSVGSYGTPGHLIARIEVEEGGSFI